MKQIAVIGLGFIGLPLSLSYAMHNNRVYGIDINEKLVNEINSGITYHKENYKEKTVQEILKNELKNKRFSAHTSLEAIPDSVEAYIITVGIPVKDKKELVYEHLEDCAKSLGKKIKKGDTIILRSTVVPGYTNGAFRPILEKQSGLIAGEDFYLAYASERIAEGRAFKEFEEFPVAIGGVNEESVKKAEEILTIVTKAETKIASSMEVVELAKVVENVQRDVNIAMVQQFAELARRMNLDSRELIEVANTHPRVNLLIPGPGVGGYCLPNAYYYLQPKAQELNVEDELFLLSGARKYNDLVPSKIVNFVEKHLEKIGKKLKESKVAVFGLAMKDFSNDDRISPPVEIAYMLEKRGASVYAYDPAVPTSYSFKYDDVEKVVTDADVLLFLNEQEEMSELDYKRIKALMKDDAFVYDTKHFFKKIDSQGLKVFFY